MSHKRTSVSRRAMLALASIAATLVVVELVLEAMPNDDRQVPRRRSIRLKEHAPGREVSQAPSDEYLAETDGLVRRTYPFRVDAKGFIRPSEVHADPDLKIVFLGGSTTECKFVLEDNRFPYRVGRLLEKQFGITCNSYNGGVSGNNSMHSNLVLLGKVVPLQPDVAVLMHNVNDLVILLYAGTYWNSHPQRSVLVPLSSTETTGRPTMAPMMGIKAMSRAVLPEVYSRLQRLKQTLTHAPNAKVDEWRHQRGRKLDFQKEQMLEAFERSLTTFCNVCQAHRIHPILMTQANRLTNDAIRTRWEESLEGTQVPYEEVKGMYDNFNQMIRSVAEDQGALMVDLAAAIPQSSEFIYDSAHLNDQGSRLAADVIARDIGSLVANLQMLTD